MTHHLQEHLRTMDLDQYRVGSPQSVFYVPEYISETEEVRLLADVHGARTKWQQLSGRRLQNHGGIVHPKGLIPTPLPRWLESITLRLHKDTALYGDTPPNHVLVNAYLPGEGILPHQDGPLYLPAVCILSLQSPAVLRFWRKQAEGGTGGLDPAFSVLLMPRSLVVFKDDAYEHCLHGIEEVQEERLDASVVNAGMVHADTHTVLRTGERVSLTVRRVLKVKKQLIRL